jgi:hypothetical protein
MSDNATHRPTIASAGLETLLPASEAGVMRVIWARSTRRSPRGATSPTRPQ